MLSQQGRNDGNDMLNQQGRRVPRSSVSSIFGSPCSSRGSTAAAAGNNVVPASATAFSNQSRSFLTASQNSACTDGCSCLSLLHGSCTASLSPGSRSTCSNRRGRSSCGRAGSSSFGSAATACSLGGPSSSHGTSTASFLSATSISFVSATSSGGSRSNACSSGKSTASMRFFTPSDSPIAAQQQDGAHQGPSSSSSSSSSSSRVDDDGLSTVVVAMLLGHNSEATAQRLFGISCIAGQSPSSNNKAGPPHAQPATAPRGGLLWQWIQGRW